MCVCVCIGQVCVYNNEEITFSSVKKYDDDDDDDEATKCTSLYNFRYSRFCYLCVCLLRYVAMFDMKTVECIKSTAVIHTHPL